MQISNIEFGAKKLTALASGLGFSASRQEETKRLFQLLLSGWGERPIGTTPSFPSDVGDDHTPFEFSAAFGGPEPELRILLEPQGHQPTLGEQQRASLELSTRLASDFNVDLSRFRAIQDLFCPADPQGLFSIWYAVCLWPSRDPEFKLYLNPQVQGEAKAAGLVEEALVRLGYGRAWAPLSRVGGRRGPLLDEIKYFSLDLSAKPSARLKIYFRHHDVNAGELEEAFALSSNHRAGDAREVCVAMSGSEGPFHGKPVGSCFAYTEADDQRPKSATVYFPIAHYVEDDSVARTRLTQYFQQHGLPVASYHSAVAQFSSRALHDGVGMHSYIGVKRDADQRRATIYFSPEAYRVEPPRPIAMAKAPAALPAEDIVTYFEAHSMAEHPLFSRMAREPVDMHKLWLLLANAQIAIVKSFSRRLAMVTARVTSEAVRSILAKQLNDELGNGDPTKAHSLLFENMLAGLSAWKIEADAASDLFAPGRQLSDVLEAIASDDNGWVGVGASIVAEVYGKQVDVRTGQALRRQKALDPESLSWMTLHEELEVEHANESLVLARMLPTDGEANAGAWLGAQRISAASWTFFDSVYELCFGGQMNARK